MNKVHASVVLSGDPKQLDAVTKSEQAKELGFRTSFLEHLCERQLYKRDDKTKKYNEIYITQLVRNYRSHPSILKLSNELFYDNSLISMASEGKTNRSTLFEMHLFGIFLSNHFLTDVTGWFINSYLLPSKKFPIIFKSVQSYNVERSEVNKR